MTHTRQVDRSDERLQALSALVYAGGELTQAERTELALLVMGRPVRRIGQQMRDAMLSLGLAATAASERHAELRTALFMDDDSLDAWKRRSGEASARRRSRTVEQAQARAARRRHAVRMAGEMLVVAVLAVVLVMVLWLLPR